MINEASDLHDQTQLAMARLSGLVEEGKAAGASLRERCELEAAVLRDFADLTAATAPPESDDPRNAAARHIALGCADMARTMATQLDRGIAPMRTMNRWVQNRGSASGADRG